MPVNTNAKAIDDLLKSGVSEVIVKEDLKKKLASGKKLRIKLGIDPTGFDLHLGHMVVVHKLKEFQEMGHQIVLLFGNFTGQIGDPSGKSETRPLRTQEELEKNAVHYLKQVSPILDVDSIETRWNADWLSALHFGDVTHLASQFTVAQMLERDMYQDRIKANKPIALHEFMYPLMQGYDSVALEADVELGGTDQTFNLLAGRVIQKAYGQEPQNIMTVPLLVGTDGEMKMGKTTGNYIAVGDSPEEMYGKTMSIPDHLILTYMELAARAKTKEIQICEMALKNGENPRNLKMDLASRLVRLYHGENAVKAAEEHFKSVVQNKEIPDEIEVLELPEKNWLLVDLLVDAGFCGTKSDARRLVEGGGVKVNQLKMVSIETKILSANGEVLIQAGKRKFKRIVFNK